MASYNNFQSDNAKFTKDINRDNYNPNFNPTISATGFKESTSFIKNFDKYMLFIQWARWFP